MFFYEMHYTPTLYNVLGAIPSGVGGHVQQPPVTWGQQQPHVWGQPTQQPITGM